MSVKNIIKLIEDNSILVDNLEVIQENDDVIKISFNYTYVAPVKYVEIKFIIDSEEDVSLPTLREFLW